MAKKELMMKQTPNPPQQFPIERKVWHGTSHVAVSSIQVHGFNRSYAGDKNGNSLAHLSRRLTASQGELIVYPLRRRQCVRVSVHTFKHEYLHSQWADCNQILSEALLGWGKGYIRFWARLDQNSGFHGNR